MPLDPSDEDDSSEDDDPIYSMSQLVLAVADVFLLFAPLLSLMPLDPPERRRSFAALALVAVVPVAVTAAIVSIAVALVAVVSAAVAAPVVSVAVELVAVVSVAVVALDISLISVTDNSIVR